MLHPKLKQSASTAYSSAPFTSLFTGITVGCENGVVYRSSPTGVVSTYTNGFQDPIIGIGTSGNDVVAMSATTLKCYSSINSTKFSLTRAGSLICAAGAGSVFFTTSGTNLYRHAQSDGSVTTTHPAPTPWTGLQQQASSTNFAAAGNRLYRIQLNLGATNLTHNSTYDAGETIYGIASSIVNPPFVFYGGTGGNLYRASSADLTNPVLIDNLGATITYIDFWQFDPKFFVVATNTGLIRAYSVTSNATGTIALLYEVNTGKNITRVRCHYDYYTFISTDDGKIIVYNGLGQLYGTLLDMGIKINDFVHG